MKGNEINHKSRCLSQGGSSNNAEKQQSCHGNHVSSPAIVCCLTLLIPIDMYGGRNSIERGRLVAKLVIEGNEVNNMGAWVLFEVRYGSFGPKLPFPI